MLNKTSPLNRSLRCGSSTLMAAALLASSVAQAAPTCTRSSPAHTVALLELYTSEGCNSCPPADRLLGEVAANTAHDTSKVIPLALHVDYWDSLGWSDRFATPGYSQRQRWLGMGQTIYTPEFFVAGKEWRRVHDSLETRIASVNDQPARIDLHVAISNDNASNIRADIIAKPTAGNSLGEQVRVFAALAQNGLVSMVKAGENSGATLHHDAVARQWVGPLALSASTVFHRPEEKTPLSVVVFAQDMRSGEVLQALSVPLSCDGS